MKKEVLLMAVKSLKDRSVRSWITIFGIVVSVAVIFILLTLSAGLNNAVVELFDDFGTNRIFISANQISASVGGLSDRELDENIVDKIEGLSYIDAVIPSLVKSAQKVEYRNTEVFTTIWGIPNEDAYIVEEQYQFDEKLIEGQFWREGEKGVAVVGYNVAFDNDNFFNKDLDIRNSITINDKKFRVIGIYEKVGSSDDDLIYIPMEDARELFDEPTSITFADAILEEGANMDLATARIERILEKELGEDNFVVITPEAILEQFRNTTGIISYLLLAIASISLIVGAVGIANTMFTAVLEREKEIGIMKSIGAKNSDIMTQFLFESGLIGIIGGLAGVLIGISISLIAEQIILATGFTLLKITIDFGYIAFCLGFSFITGMLSGIIPSYIASRKKIIDALRDD